MLGFMRGKDLGGGAIAPVQGGHSGLSADSVFKRSASNAITPDNPPDSIFQVSRSMPVFCQPREFSAEEADALEQLAKKKKKAAKATARAAEQHKRILEADAKTNRNCQKMFRNEAIFELKTQKYKGSTASFLHGQREGYARLGKGLESAELSADQAIQSLMANL